MQKILLGRTIDGHMYLDKHSWDWDCDWYWGFGYMGNKNCHLHLDSLFTREHDVTSIFEATWIRQDQWWIIRELFSQAYELKVAASVYYRGSAGYAATVPGVTDVLQSNIKAAGINADLKIILDIAWQYLETQYALSCIDK